MLPADSFQPFCSLDQVIMHISYRHIQTHTVSATLFYRVIYLLIKKPLKFGWMLLCHYFPLGEI